jgi:diamine N-acetyltransferase
VPTHDSVVTLREITPETSNAILALSVADSQKHLVASNERSIAQAHFEEAAWFRAIYADEEPVGFVMLHDETLRAEPREEGYLVLWRMMVDERFQGMGFGWKAMEFIIEHARTRPGVTRLQASWRQEEGNAGDFYRKLGFVPTKVDEDGEQWAALDL